VRRNSYWNVFRGSPWYLTDKTRREKINEVVRNEEGIAMAGKVLLEISRDERERVRLMSEYKYELDTQSRIVDAKREGIREGRQEGREEGRFEVAKNALVKGASIEFVREITGLDIETIKKTRGAVTENGCSPRRQL
jgi:predicted transposase/invertase (TIGR01784 family)